MDWADKLVAKKQKRGNNSVTAEYLREKTKKICEENINRWDDKWTTEKREKATRKETRRLIKLEEEYDLRDEVVYQYKQNGVDVTIDYSQPGKISSVKLDFTDEEWADVLNKEGKYLPICCANVSRIRDILQNACREDHYIEVEDLFEVYYLAKHEGGFRKDEPIGRAMKLWESVKDNVRTRSRSRSVNPEDPAAALEMLYSAAGTICWDNLYSRSKDGKDRTFDRHMNRNYALATIQNAVRVLFLKLNDLDCQRNIEGYGLFQQNGEIGHTHSGLAIFRTKELAQEVSDKWNEDEKAMKKRKSKTLKHEPNVYTVKKVRVSMKHGVETLPDDHVIEETLDVKNCKEPKAIRF